MNRYRSWCSLLFGYDWVGIPLVYTQVSNTVHVTSVSARPLPHLLGWPGRALTGFLSVPGCHSGRLHLLLCVPDWTPVFGSHRRLRGAWLRSLHSDLYSSTILLLCWMAQGNRKSQCMRPLCHLSCSDSAHGSFTESCKSFLSESQVDLIFNSSEMLLLFNQELKWQGCGWALYCSNRSSSFLQRDKKTLLWLLIFEVFVCSH